MSEGNFESNDQKNENFYDEFVIDQQEESEQMLSVPAPSFVNDMTETMQYKISNDKDESEFLRNKKQKKKLFNFFKLGGVLKEKKKRIDKNIQSGDLSSDDKLFIENFGNYFIEEDEKLPAEERTYRSFLRSFNKKEISHKDFGIEFKDLIGEIDTNFADEEKAESMLKVAHEKRYFGDKHCKKFKEMEDVSININRLKAESKKLSSRAKKEYSDEEFEKILQFQKLLAGEIKTADDYKTILEHVLGKTDFNKKDLEKLLQKFHDSVIEDLLLSSEMQERFHEFLFAALKQAKFFKYSENKKYYPYLKIKKIKEHGEDPKYTYSYNTEKILANHYLTKFGEEEVNYVHTREEGKNFVTSFNFKESSFGIGYTYPNKGGIHLNEVPVFSSENIEEFYKDGNKKYSILNNVDKYRPKTEDRAATIILEHAKADEEGNEVYNIRQVPTINGVNQFEFIDYRRSELKVLDNEKIKVMKNLEPENIEYLKRIKLKNFPANYKIVDGKKLPPNYFQRLNKKIKNAVSWHKLTKDYDNIKKDTFIQRIKHLYYHLKENNNITEKDILCPEIKRITSSKIEEYNKRINRLKESLNQNDDNKRKLIENDIALIDSLITKEKVTIFYNYLKMNDLEKSISDTRVTLNSFIKNSTRLSEYKAIVGKDGKTELMITTNNGEERMNLSELFPKNNKKNFFINGFSKVKDSIINSTGKTVKFLNKSFEILKSDKKFVSAYKSELLMALQAGKSKFLEKEDKIKSMNFINSISNNIKLKLRNYIKEIKTRKEKKGSEPEIQDFLMNKFSKIIKQEYKDEFDDFIVYDDEKNFFTSKQVREKISSFFTDGLKSKRFVKLFNKLNMEEQGYIKTIIADIERDKVFKRMYNILKNTNDVLRIRYSKWHKQSKKRQSKQESTIKENQKKYRKSRKKHNDSDDFIRYRQRHTYI